MSLKYAIYTTKIGDITIVYSNNQVNQVLLGKRLIENSIQETSPLSDQTFKELNEYFEGSRKEFDIPLNPQGTDFQKKVWNALLEIPYGKTMSYGEIARIIGNPNIFPS